jgi:hypothetical protein
MWLLTSTKVHLMLLKSVHPLSKTICELSGSEWTYFIDRFDSKPPPDRVNQLFQFRSTCAIPF